MLTWDEYLVELVAVAMPFACTGGLGMVLLGVILVWGVREDR